MTPSHEDPFEPPEPPATRDGLAWERRDELGHGAAMWRTIGEVVLSPVGAFRRMKLEGGWAEPLGFAVVVGSVCAWIGQLWQMLTSSLMVGMPGFSAEEVAIANAQQIWLALFAPLLVCAATFFGAAVVHLLLIMLGGAPRPFEVTVRVFSYTWAVGVFNLIPVCGILVAALWRVVVQVIAVREAQEVPTGRAAAAVLLPVTVACVCLALVTVLAVGLAGLVPPGP